MIVSDEFKNLIEADTAVDRFQLVDESARSPALLSKYLLMYMEEKMKLRLKEKKYKTLYKKRREYYLGKGTDEEYQQEPLPKKIMRQEVEVWLEADDKLQQAHDSYLYQKCIVEYLERMIKEIERRTFTIKNMQEMIKFESGV